MDIPKTYYDLNDEELKMLIYFNTKQQEESDDIYEKIRLQQKIDYIKKMLE